MVFIFVLLLLCRFPCKYSCKYLPNSSNNKKKMCIKYWRGFGLESGWEKSKQHMTAAPSKYYEQKQDVNRYYHWMFVWL